MKKSIVFLMSLILTITAFSVPVFAEDIGGSVSVVSYGSTPPQYGNDLEATVYLPSEQSGHTTETQWMRDAFPIPGATGNSYTVEEEDVGALISVKVTSPTLTGALYSNVLGPVEKAESPETSMIRLVDKTETSLTVLNYDVAPDNSNADDYEYALVAVPNMSYGSASWQDSGVFTGLSPATQYHAISRKKETATHQPTPDYSVDSGSWFTNKTFSNLTEGYKASSIEATTFDFTRMYGNVQILLSGTDSSAFEVLNWTNPTNLSGSGSGSFDVKAVTGLSAGTYEATVNIVRDTYTVDTIELSLTVETKTVTDPDPGPLSHDVNGGVITFFDLEEGYSMKDSETVTITAEGSHTNITVTLAGNHADKFTVTPDSFSTATDSALQITIEPENGLTEGTYAALCTVASDEYAQGTSFGVTQTVEAEDSTSTVDAVIRVDDDEAPAINNRLRIKAIDSERGLPVAGAMVRIDGRRVYTNSRGYVYVSFDEAGTFPYTVSKTGYLPLEGSFRSPATYTTGTTYLYETAVLEMGVLELHHEFMESELAVSGSVTVPFEKEQMKDLLTAGDIRFDRNIEGLTVIGVDAEGEDLHIKLMLEEDIAEDIEDFKITINEEKYQPEMMMTITCHVTAEASLILLEEKMDISRIQLISENTAFTPTIKKEDLMLTIKGSQLNPYGLAIKEVYYISENELQVKLSLKAPLKEDVGPVVVYLKRNGLTNYSEEIRYLGSLLIKKTLLSTGTKGEK